MSIGKPKPRLISKTFEPIALLKIMSGQRRERPRTPVPAELLQPSYILKSLT